MEPLRIEPYNTAFAANIEDRLRELLADSWLAAFVPQIFQICDELIKNALKSNFKFLQLWRATRNRLLAAQPGTSTAELDDWLREIFFSGEERLLEQHLAHIADQSEHIRNEVRSLLNLENRYVREGQLSREQLANPDTIDDLAVAPLLASKRLARELNIHAYIELERSADEILIKISNDSPILAEDVERIRTVRARFREYRSAGRMQEFFIENLDTSGGGHGLGYAIMDSILCEMNLDPDRSLYLIAATRTMVLLVLPLQQGSGSDSGCCGESTEVAAASGKSQSSAS